MEEHSLLMNVKERAFITELSPCRRNVSLITVIFMSGNVLSCYETQKVL